MTAKQEKNNKILNLCTESILSVFKNLKSANRKQILTSATEYLRKKDKSIKVNDGKSYIGTTLNNLILNKQLINNNGLIYINSNDDALNIDKQEVKRILLSELNKKTLTEKQLVSNIKVILGADKTKSTKDDQQIKDFVKTCLKEYLKENVLEFNENNKQYSLRKIIEEIKSPSKNNETSKSFKEQFLERIYLNGGSFFERFVANLLEKYFVSNGRDVIDCEVVGGSNDHGIDVILKTEDELGFIETILIQAKNRINTAVNEPEVRDFYGSFTLANGSKGIYITTGTINESADKLVHSLNNIIAIDGNKLYSLCESILYGISKKNNNFVFDDRVFDI